MSLKPKKHSEIQKIKEKMATEKSKMNTKSKLPPYTMIVSEGTKTEPFDMYPESWTHIYELG